MNTEGPGKIQRNPVQDVEAPTFLLERDLDRRQGEDISNLLKTIGRYKMKLQSSFNPMDKINAKLSLAVSLGRREVEVGLYTRALDDINFAQDMNELDWRTHMVGEATGLAESRLKLKRPHNPAGAPRQKTMEIKQHLYQDMDKWKSDPDKLIQDEKAKHADYAQKIKEAHKAGKHDEAEDLRWYKKRYGQAWGHHLALIKGIDKKQEYRATVKAGLRRRPRSSDLPQQERKSLSISRKGSNDIE